MLLLPVEPGLTTALFVLAPNAFVVLGQGLVKSELLSSTPCSGVPT